MTKKTNLKTWLVISIALFSALSPNLLTAGTYSGGNGTVSNPYIISDANDLREIGMTFLDWNANFEQINDIDLSAYDGKDGRPKLNTIGEGYTECNMIFECWFVGTPFTGTYNGSGFIISNFTYDETAISDGDYIGLFGVVEGRIENVLMANPQIDVYDVDGLIGDGIGPLVGFLSSGVVDRCHVYGGSVSADYRAGGLVGLCSENTLISNCSSTADVSGHAEIGGLVGDTYYGQIATSYAKGNITGTGSTGTSYYLGGLVGANYYGSIDDCYATGDIIGVYNVGGLIGENRGPVTNCYAAGSVSGTSSNVGGLIGLESVNGTVISCFWNTETCLPVTSSPAGTGKTTAEMKQKDTFTNWDFTEDWGIEDNQTYPFLKLTYPVGDINLSKDVNLGDLAIIAYHWLETTTP